MNIPRRGGREKVSNAAFRCGEKHFYLIILKSNKVYGTIIIALKNKELRKGKAELK